MNARGQATGASTTMHTLMIHTVLAPNLQIGQQSLGHLLCFKGYAEQDKTPDKGSLIDDIYSPYLSESRHRQPEVAHQRP